MESETIRTRCTKTPPMRIAMRLPILLPVMEPTAMQSASDQTTSPLMMKTTAAPMLEDRLSTFVVALA